MNPIAPSRWTRAGAALIGLLFGLLSLLPGAPSARAEEATAPLEVIEVGWDGYVTHGTWVPLRLRLLGGAQDQEAEVEVTLGEKVETEPGVLVRLPHAGYAQEVALPANAVKEVTLWVPSDRGLSGTVRLKAEGREVASREIELRATKAPYWPLIGLLSGEESLVAAVGRIEMPLQNLPTPIHAARLKAEVIPIQAERLRGLRGILVQGNAPAGMSDGQRQAVLEWVRNGGHLLLAGGPDSALTSVVLPPAALPVTFGGAELDQDLSPLFAWAGVQTPAAGARGPAVRMQAEGGSVLAGTTERPLAWRTELGRGTVTVLAVDPTLEPLVSSEERTRLLKAALSAALFDEQMSEEERWRLTADWGQIGYHQLRQGLDGLPVGAYPGWRQVTLYLGGFALLAGPVLHLLFWRPRHRGWVWVAVPAASVLVASSIYLFAIALGGRDLLTHTLSHVQIDPGSGIATQAVMVGLYAPMHQRLTLSMDPAAADASILMEGRGWGPWGQKPPEEPPYRLVTGQETRLELIGGEGAMRPVYFRRSLQDRAGHLAARLTLEGDRIVGTVTNATPYHLDQAWVVAGSTAQRLGEIAPGQMVEVALDPVPRTNPFYHFSVSQLFLGEQLPEDELRRRIGIPPGAPLPVNTAPYLELPRDGEARRRAQLLDSLIQRPSKGAGAPSMPLSLFAFTREPVGPEVLKLKRHPAHHLTLIEQRLEFDLARGPFRLPPALVPPEIISPNGLGGGSNGSLDWVEISGSPVDFEFAPPLPKRVGVTALEITTRQLGQAVAWEPSRGPTAPMSEQTQGAEPGLFQIYNWQTGAFEPLPAGQERSRLTNPAPYLGPEGLVRVRVGRADKAMRFLLPQLTVEGRAGG